MPPPIAISVQKGCESVEVSILDRQYILYNIGSVWPVLYYLLFPMSQARMARGAIKYLNLSISFAERIQLQHLVGS